MFIFAVEQLFRHKMPMEQTKITSSEMPLFMYISEIFTKETATNKTQVSRQDAINKGVKLYLDKKSSLENCQALKQFLEHKKAEIIFEGLEGPFYAELIERIDAIVNTLNTGIELGEKEQNYHSGSISRYKSYSWYNEEHNWDPQTLEGYLKLHYDTFSVPTFTVGEFLHSGYFKHCLMHNWGAKESAETFCRLYDKAM